MSVAAPSSSTGGGGGTRAQQARKLLESHTIDIAQLWQQAKSILRDHNDTGTLAKKAIDELVRLYTLFHFIPGDHLSMALMRHLHANLIWISSIVRDRSQYRVSYLQALRLIKISTRFPLLVDPFTTIVISDLMITLIYDVDSMKDPVALELSCGICVDLVTLQWSSRKKEIVEFAQKEVQVYEALKFAFANRINILVRNPTGLTSLVQGICKIADLQFLKHIGQSMINFSEESNAEIPDSLSMFFNLRLVLGIRSFYWSFAKRFSSLTESMEPIVNDLQRFQAKNSPFSLTKKCFALLGVCLQPNMISFTFPLLLKSLNSYVSEKNELMDVLFGLCCAHSALTLKKANADYQLTVSFEKSTVVYACQALCFSIGLEYPLKDVFFVQVQQTLSRETPVIPRGAATLLKESKLKLQEELFLRIHGVVQCNYGLWRAALLRILQKRSTVQDSLTVKDTSRPSVTFLSVVSLTRTLLDSIQKSDRMMFAAFEILSMLEFARVKYDGFLHLLETLYQHGERNASLRDSIMKQLESVKLSEDAQKTVKKFKLNDTLVLNENPFGKQDRPALGRVYFKLGLMLRWTRLFTESFTRENVLPLCLAYITNDNKTMNLRAHLVYETCISQFPNLGAETGARYVDESIANFPQKVQIGGFSKSLASLLKTVDPEDALAFNTQQKLLAKVLDQLKVGREPPKPLVMLLMHSIQWIGMAHLNKSLDMLEKMFRDASALQRKSLSLMMSAVLANNFDATIKDHCIDWYLRLAKELQIIPAIAKKSRM